MKEKQKNTQRGITLIALVITIIVLLILAMVSIKIALDGGLIEKTKEAVGIHNEKEAEQKSTLDTMTSMIYAAKKEVEPPTEEEKNALKTLSKDSLKLLAGNTGTVLESSSDLRKGDIAVMIIPTDDIYIYDFRDEFKCYYYFNSEETIKNLKYKTLKKTKTWYINYTVSDDVFEEYTGPSPIQVSDFPSDCTYSESYLEKIIKSFGTEPDAIEKISLLTDEEKAQCYGGDGSYLIAGYNVNFENIQESELVIYVYQEDETSSIIIQIIDNKNNKQYGYTNTRNGLNGTNQKYNSWLVFDNAVESQPIWKKYTGPSPIQASDFASGKIYCSSYLDRIIASFN